LGKRRDSLDILLGIFRIYFDGAVKYFFHLDGVVWALHFAESAAWAVFPFYVDVYFEVFFVGYRFEVLDCFAVLGSYGNFYEVEGAGFFAVYASYVAFCGVYFDFAEELGEAFGSDYGDRGFVVGLDGYGSVWAEDGADSAVVAFLFVDVDGWMWGFLSGCFGVFLDFDGFFGADGFADLASYACGFVEG